MRYGTKRRSDKQEGLNNLPLFKAFRESGPRSEESVRAIVADPENMSAEKHSFRHIW